MVHPAERNDVFVSRLSPLEGICYKFGIGLDEAILRAKRRTCPIRGEIIGSGARLAAVVASGGDRSERRVFLTRIVTYCCGCR